MYGGYHEYVSVAEKKARALKASEKLKKKNKDISPVILNGTKLAETWWGKAWNKNLESYSDYENRIGRGKSYVRQGAVLHLAIKAGQVEALVQGSRKKPYEVNIDIKSLSNEKWEKLLSMCEGKLDSLQELLEGKFPKALQELFLSHDTGLFPSPKEISFQCSCPDFAYMCKHIAAVLFAIGSRLDTDPSLFFVLRGVSLDALIEKAILKKTDKLINKSGSKSRRVIAETDLSNLFGIDINEDTGAVSIDSLTIYHNSETLPEDAVATPVKRKRGRPRKELIKEGD